MLALAAGTKVYLACKPVSMRKGFDGLAALTRDVFDADPFSGHLFLFRGRGADYFKAILWDGSGMCLFAKRLEKGRFVWPTLVDGGVVLTPAQLALLVEGIDWRRTVAPPPPVVPTLLKSTFSRAFLLGATARLVSSGMSLATLDLPSDVHDLRALTLALQASLSTAETALATTTIELSSTAAELRIAKSSIQLTGLEIAKLKAEIARLRRMQFGQSSERLTRAIDQLELRLEELEADETAAASAAAAAASPGIPVPEPQKGQAKRLPLSAHLPRREIVHPAPGLDGCVCGGRMTSLGESVTEVLEYVPGRLEVIRHVRPKLACQRCDAITQAPDRAHVVDIGFHDAHTGRVLTNGGRDIRRREMGVVPTRHPFVGVPQCFGNYRHRNTRARQSSAVGAAQIVEGGSVDVPGDAGGFQLA